MRGMDVAAFARRLQQISSYLQYFPMRRVDGNLVRPEPSLAYGTVSIQKGICIIKVENYDLYKCTTKYTSDTTQIAFVT